MLFLRLTTFERFNLLIILNDVGTLKTDRHKIY